MHSKEFIQFALEQNILSFGEFTLKSGRISPYFYNAGKFNTGKLLQRLGHYYAEAIVNANIEYDVLFGPAYKGIPLVCAVAMSLANDFNIDVPYCFNRKEVKDHGEGGNIVGAPLQGRVLIIDDVITAGTAFREAKEIIEQHGAVVAGIAIALDRQERGQGKLSAIDEIKKEYQLPVVSIVSLQDLLIYCDENVDLQPYTGAMRNYQKEYRSEFVGN